MIPPDLTGVFYMLLFADLLMPQIFLAPDL